MYPDDRRYSKEHEWVKEDGSMGITSFAQNELGDIVYVELPEQGKQVAKNDVLGVIADPFGQNEVEVLASTDGIVIGKTNLPLVHEGEGLFHLARHEGKQVIARWLDEFDPETDYESGLTSELAAQPPIV